MKSHEKKCVLLAGYVRMCGINGPTQKPSPVQWYTVSSHKIRQIWSKGNLSQSNDLTNLTAIITTEILKDMSASLLYKAGSFLETCLLL